MPTTAYELRKRNSRCQLEDSEKTKSSEDGDTKGATSQLSPDNLESWTDDNDAVEAVELETFGSHEMEAASQKNFAV